MTRHNLALHISWLLSGEFTVPVGGHTVPASSATNLAARTETIYAESEEEDAEERIRSPLPSPSPTRQSVQTVNVPPDFQRPSLPSKITPQPPLRDLHNSFAGESMGKLSSASRSARPSLVSQHQLATPASTTSSTVGLTQGYTTFIRENGKSQPIS